ncbi:MAG: lactate dehydrogenase, partial [Planctomycetota bacterium]
MKLSIVGMGHVGSAAAFASMLRGACSEMTLINRNPDRARGEALDLSHAGSFLPDPVRVRAGGVEDVAGSGVVLLTLSVPWDPKRHRGRSDLARENFALFEQWIPPIARHAPDAALLVVTNPVD